ncbi:ribosome maturation factor RimM [Sphingomicrobium sediminis]|uniref:Ribosome maturation factor RimM n=1 Tax=Sphingomicrobium sediminis TaxID=2950949 RepID=A0A9X2EK95_9SPHN|nr:ribosome maturation factor RimM [Sphingomicrobium sediminis]MCM8556904.1 ribosome maturation factor RimM [Sphingomicrobium sediminis]
MAGASQDRVALAAVAGAHGVKGELRLKLFAEGIDSLKKQKALFVGEDERRLLSVRANAKGAIAKLDGVNSREAAEALRGSLLEIARETLPELGEGEYYFSDLLSLLVIDDRGAEVGTIVAVENFGASDVIEIERPTGKRFMVPMTENAVPEWNKERLVINAAFAED